MSDLTPLQDALSQILAAIPTLPAETIPLPEVLGRTLAADLIADVALPPFANSSMDGFAVHAADTIPAAPDSPVQLTVTMDILAGESPAQALAPGTAARIMTGAPLPVGADAVVPVEDTDAAWTAYDNALPPTVQIRQAVQPGASVRPIGEDIQVDQRLLPAGTLLGPAEIGILAALGQSLVAVHQQPKVAILASGDELVEVNEPLAPGKIRDSNGYVLEALVRQHGGIPIRIPTAKDTLQDTRRSFHEALAHEPDLLLSSGGVSMGTHDVVRAVLDELGTIKIWRINLRPGKPLAFGQLQGHPFFGLPGNPVSTQVTFDIFVRPALHKMRGSTATLPMAQAVLDEDIPTDGRLTYFRVKLSRDDQQQLHATITGTQSSGAMMSMVLADGLLIVPAGIKKAQRGAKYPVRLLKPV